MFREAARNSIGSHLSAKSLELKHIIKLIRELDNEIDEFEAEIKIIMDEISSPILSIPGINYHMASMIIADIGNFSKFNSPDKILAYAGMSSSTYQSGQLDNCYSHMEKRGSRHFRYMPPNMCIIGIKTLVHILQRNEPKANIITSLYPM